MAGTDVNATPLGRFYRWYIARPRVGQLVGRLVWGSDFASLYASLASLASAGQVPAGATVLDVACGAGLALSWLDPARLARYVGVDSSPAMLAAAERAARRRGFAGVELHLGDACSVPMADSSADAALVYNALHCVEDPTGVVAEAARCLKPGALLMGTMLVRGQSRRVDRLLAKDSMMGPGGTAGDLAGWLGGAGLGDVEVCAAGAMAAFRPIR